MVQTIEKVGGLTTLKAAASARGVSPDTVYSYAVRRGKPIYKLGNILVVDEKDIQEYRKGHDANATVGAHSA